MKVVVTGPESSGKSTLCKDLANHYKIAWVPEYSRTYLNQRQGKYEEADLVSIAKGQIEIEDKALAKVDKLVLCDTSLEVLKIWSEWKYQHCDPFIAEQALLRAPDLFLLLTPDIPWEPDPLRENPTNRDELFVYYQESLSTYSSKVVEISGDKGERLTQAIAAIDSVIIGN
jgi:NadR type nicotinamide-nucleotide adenylyltransferase